MSGWRRSAVVTLGVAGALTFGTGVALGYYNATIGPTAVTATAADGTVVLEASAGSAEPLWPGGPAADVTVTVRNPFPQPLVVDRVAATATGCTAPDLVVTQPAELPLTVPGSGSVTTLLSDVVGLGLAASADCQGAEIVVSYTVSGTL